MILCNSKKYLKRHLSDFFRVLIAILKRIAEIVKNIHGIMHE